jgi:hypothetical protein
MKLIRITSYLLLINILVLNQSCKNPMDDLGNIQLGINGGFFANPTSILSFRYSDNDKSIPLNIRISISGVGADHVYDDNGEKKFNVNEAGYCKFLLSQSANPTDNNPYILNIKATADGCLPINTQIYLFSKTEVKNFTLKFIKYANAPSNYKVQQYSAKFYGKKAIDTLVFSHTNNDGITFTFKYPTAGVKFVHRNFINIQHVEPAYVSVNTSTTATPHYKDTTYLTAFERTRDSAVFSDPPTLFFNDYQPLDGTPQTIIQVPYVEMILANHVTTTYTYTTVTHIDSIPERITIEVKEILPDTVPVQDVTAIIISNIKNEVSLSGFYDGTTWIDKPRKFIGVVEVPSIEFVSTNGEYISPIYTYQFGGPVIEAVIGGNYKLYIDGTGYNCKTGQYFPIQNTTNCTSNSGTYVFTNAMFTTNTAFFYTSIEVGCGFANINFNYANSDTDLANLKSFVCDYKIENFTTNYTAPVMYGKVSYSDAYGAPGTIVRIPAFSGDIVRVTLTTDHEYNICDGNPPLLIKTQDVLLCDYVNKELKFSCDYNTVNFLKNYVFAKLTVTSRLICRTGSKITMPNTQVFYTRAGCPLFNGTININSGVGNYTIKEGDTYGFYIVSPLNGLRVLADALPFNKNVAPIPVLGSITDTKNGTKKTAYDGFLTYDQLNHSYNLDLNIYNSAVQWNVPGCN